MKIKRSGKTTPVCISLTQTDIDKANYIIKSIDNEDIATMSALVRLLIRREYLRRETMHR